MSFCISQNENSNNPLSLYEYCVLICYCKCVDLSQLFHAADSGD